MKIVALSIHICALLCIWSHSSFGYVPRCELASCETVGKSMFTFR